MRAGRVEVIPRAVKVDRQQENGVIAVLLAVGLRLDKQHFLSQSVRRVGLFGITVPQMLFLERDGCELGIGANGTDGHKLFHAALPSLVHQLHAHHQVIVEKLGGLGHICANAAYMRGQMDDDIRLGVAQHARDVFWLYQVIFLKLWDEYFPRAFRAQVGNQVRAQKARAAGDADPFSGKANFLVHNYLDIRLIEREG